MEKPNEHGTSRRPARTPQPAASAPSSRTGQTIGLAAALGCFTLALVMMGGACCLLLDWPIALDLRSAALAVCTLAAALAFAGFGVLCLLQSKDGGRSLAGLPPRDPLECKLDQLNLTEKEREVARLILRHRSYRDIAQLCHIAPRTVQFHATNVFRKAQVSRRRDFEHRMLTPSPTALPLASPAESAEASNASSQDDTPASERPSRATARHPARCPRPGTAPTTARSRQSQRSHRHPSPDPNLTK